MAHFTKFESLNQLCIDLGCTYFKKLNVSQNANYSSHRIISEWLDIMSQILEEKVIMNVQASPAIGFLADKSTDISITKELILYACISCGSEVHACFLKITMAHFWKIGRRNPPYCCHVTVGLPYLCLCLNVSHAVWEDNRRLVICVPLADELIPMHHKCVAGGCSRATGGIDLWWRQRSLLHFTKSDSLKKRWPAAVGRSFCAW